MFRKQIRSPKRQQGNLIIISVFVIVVMGMLAANLSRISWSNQDTLTREYLGTQAWFLAHSGNEWAMTVLFPLDGGDTPTDLLARCNSTINGSAGGDAATALIDNANIPCNTLTIECTSPPLDPNDSSQLDSTIPEDLQYYKVTSTAICGSDQFQVQRVQEMWVRGVKDD